MLIHRGMHTHCATTGMHPKEPHTAQLASEFDAKGNVNLRESSQHVSGRQTKFPEGMEYDRSTDILKIRQSWVVLNATIVPQITNYTCPAGQK